MQELKKYIKAKNQIENKFRGLPYAHTILIYQLLSRANPISGITSDISYNNLSTLLKVNPAPGRKDSGTPTKQTIRNYIKSIERECGDHFKVISEGQSLKFYFPDMPRLFSNLLNNTEVDTELNTEVNQEDSSYLIENTEENGSFLDEPNKEVNTVLNTEANTPKEVVKNIINNKINNNNNNNKNSNFEFSNSQKTKKTISPDFYPSPEILSRAFAAGYGFAASEEVIQEFIDKNLSWGSQFADFNPVYLNFLSQYDKFQQKKAQASTQLTRSNPNERYTPKDNSHEALMARARQANANAVAPSQETELFPISRVINPEEGETYNQPHCLALA